MRPTLAFRWFLAALAATPALALAHGGADGGSHHGFAAGFTHPLTGLDHLAAMLAVGLWSGQTARSWRSALAAPLAFAAVLLGGALMAMAGLLPAALGGSIEPGIAASVLVIGLLLAARQALPVPAAVLLVTAFAGFHGAAHGHELAGAAALAGMVAATALLHAAGLGLGALLRRHLPLLARAAGAGLALLGAAMLIAG